VAWSPRGFYLAVAYADRIYILSPGQFRPVRQLRAEISDVPINVSSLAFSPDGKYFAAGFEGGAILIWRTDTWAKVMGPWGRPLTLNCGMVPSIAFNRAGTVLASGDWDNNVNIWSTRNWRKLKSFSSSVLPEDMNGASTIERTIVLQVRSIDFSPDGKYLATGGNDAVVRVWDTSTWKPVVSLEGHEHWISSLTFSADGKYLASGDHNGVIFIWDTGTWEETRQLSEHSIRCLSVAFSQDGNYLASGGDDGELFVYGPGSWGNPIKLEGHRNDVVSVAFSPDGRFLASSEIIKVIIWRTGKWSISKAVLVGLFQSGK